MHRLHGIGRVDGSADIVRIFKVCREREPFAAPGLDNNGVLLAPFGF